MITEFVQRFDAARPSLLETFKEGIPTDYKTLVSLVIAAISKDEVYNDPDPERVHEIDDGDYQGTLVYVIAAKGYQPSDYWYTKVSYGSCSGCDTLQAIDDDFRTDPAKAANDCLTLALHIIQGLYKMGDSEA